MLFPTFRFALFFFLVFFLYWYVFRLKKQRIILLICASYFFYACWDWRFCILLFGVSLLSAGFGFLLGKQKDYIPRTVTVTAATILHILLLGFFKYFYDITVFLQYTVFHSRLNIPFLYTLQEYSLLLPVGISYYTFRSLSYIFDIYLCKMRPAKSFAEVLLYISFFPQLASGPIIKADYFFASLAESLERDVSFAIKPIEFDRSVLLIICGIYKKMILAHFLLVLAVDPVFANPAQCNTFELMIGLLSYTFVIYCDFSGYSDMAIGIALLLGFHTPKNFNRPYMSQSISEFWRRWHISFSSWLRDYVYFSFGGSRFGLFRTVLALIGTMLIAGLWHGSALPFLLWGFMQGSACAIERVIAVLKKSSDHVLLWEKKKTITVTGSAVLKPSTVSFAGMLYDTCRTALVPFVRLMGVFLFVNISWLVFRSASFREIMLYIHSLKNITLPFRTVHSFVVVPLIAAAFLQIPNETIRRKSFEVYVRLPVLLKVFAVVLVCISLNIISTSGIAPFIYFGF